MTGPTLRMRAARIAVAALLVTVAAPPARAQHEPVALAGRRLDEALHALQATGLRIVYTSQLVTAEMRVVAEPRAQTGLARLVELLEPHGLGLKSGPGGTLLVVRKRRPRPEPVVGASVPRTSTDTNSGRREQFAATYREEVTVTGRPGSSPAAALGLEGRMGHEDLRTFAGGAADDPLRAVRSLPGVATGDDFRSEFSVRGSAYRHAAVIIDGAPAPWLQHATLGREDTGSLTMLRSDVVHDATLRVGAYPRRDGGQLGPQVNLTLREGSRAASRHQAGINGTSATWTSEGPIGASQRGSWLVGVRRSNVEWPLTRSDHQAAVFGYTDVQSKLVYDMRSGQQASMSLVAGASNVERDSADPLALANGLNGAGLLVAAWRSAVGDRMLVRQQFSLQAHAFENLDRSGRSASLGRNHASAYRLDVMRTALGGFLQAGAQVSRASGARRGITGIGLEASWWERSGHVSYRWTAAPGLTIEPGLRFADSTLVGRRVVDRWTEIEWRATPRLRMFGSVGVAHQFPVLEHVAGRAAGTELRSERATYIDVGVGGGLTQSTRWNVTLFTRREGDVLRESERLPRLLDGALTFEPDAAGRYANTLVGSAKGFDLLLERRGRTGVTGWVGYTFGVARHTDVQRLESFRADFDQRHVVSVAASVPVSRRTTLATTLRAGTDVPIPGYLVARDGGLFLGSERNSTALPGYARLDVRGERTFEAGRRRVVLYGEVLNLLGHENYALADRVVVPETGQVLGATERLFPRLFTAGLRFQF